MLRRLLIGLMLLAPQAASAQTNVTSYPAPWLILANATLSVSSSSSSVPLGYTPAPPKPDGPLIALVCNTGSNPAYVVLGGSTVTAATTNFAVPANPGGTPPCYTIAVGSATTIAAITSSSTTTLTISTGTGSPFGKNRGGKVRVVESGCLLISGTSTNCLLISGTTTNALLVR